MRLCIINDDISKVLTEKKKYACLLYNYYLNRAIDIRHDSGKTYAYLSTFPDILTYTGTWNTKEI